MFNKSKCFCSFVYCKFRLFLHSAQRKSGNNEPGHEAIENYYRHNGNCDAEVNAAELGAEYVPAEHLHKHRQGVPFTAGNKNKGDQKVIP